AAQFITRRYRPSIYWTTIVLISVAGTLITDTLTDGMGVPLATSTAAFAILLTITFAAWFARERTLAMKSISTVSRETFYWLAILLTFALGTAVGDLLAENYGLGYGPSLAMYGSLLALIVIAWKLKWVGEITAFWIAYVLTRPFGASLGDLLSQSPDEGGLGLGTTTTSMVFLAAIVGTVAYLAISRRDQIVNTSAK
ncbi:MAG: hypothetical protein RLZZ40_303, partial [Actinomycetota bacterium]